MQSHHVQQSYISNALNLIRLLRTKGDAVLSELRIVFAKIISDNI